MLSKVKKIFKYLCISLVPAFSAWAMTSAVILPLVVFKTKISNQTTNASLLKMEKFWSDNFENPDKENDALSDNFKFDELSETFLVNGKTSNIFQATDASGNIINENSKNIVIYSHGLESTHYSISETIFYWAKLGFRIYSYDQRGSGQNAENGTITFGYKEADDLENLYKVITAKQESANWVKPTKIVVYGESNGAATTLSFATRKQETIKAAEANGIKTMFVEESGYTSPKRQFNSLLDLHHIIPEAVVPFTLPMYRYYVGVELSSSYDYLEGIKNVKQPLFILHGNADKIVDYKMSIELYDRIENNFPTESAITSLMIGDGLAHLGITQDTSLFDPEAVVLPNFEDKINEDEIKKFPTAVQFFWRLKHWIDSDGTDKYVYKGKGEN